MCIRDRDGDAFALLKKRAGKMDYKTVEEMFTGLLKDVYKRQDIQRIRRVGAHISRRGRHISGRERTGSGDIDLIPARIEACLLYTSRCV